VLPNRSLSWRALSLGYIIYIYIFPLVYPRNIDLVDVHFFCYAITLNLRKEAVVSRPYMLSLNRCLVVLKSFDIDGVLCFLSMVEDCKRCTCKWVAALLPLKFGWPTLVMLWLGYFSGGVKLDYVPHNFHRNIIIS
jgi:hypothetical protein